MNKVYNPNGKTPLTSQELADAANAISKAKPFTADMFEGSKARQEGVGHCQCGGNGEFELLPIYHPDVKAGEKRYMVCRKCGCYSHL